MHVEGRQLFSVKNDFYILHSIFYILHFFLVNFESNSINMKKIILPYAAYNVWANQQLADCITNLSDEQLHKEINSSFNSIYKTFLHLWDVESVWWQRVKMQEV